MRFLFVVAAVILPLSIFKTAAAAETSAEAPPDSVTFNKHIAPILFQHCAGCHHPGEVAPFSLLSYADAKKRDKQIQTVTISCRRGKASQGMANSLASAD